MEDFVPVPPFAAAELPSGPVMLSEPSCAAICAAPDDDAEGCCDGVCAWAAAA